jgi:hypothetical protein
MDKDTLWDLLKEIEDEEKKQDEKEYQQIQEWEKNNEST